ncbi:MAG TPA: hypothetical protein VGW38_19005 [Chloroflexota bacterium]|nr:hypothetical protein [Chloroflexota bacterium]
MQTTTLITGVLGGVFGILMGLIAMAVGGTANVFEEGSGNTAVWLGLSAIAAATVAIICASLAFGGTRPDLMAALLIVSGIWHLISISFFAIPGTVLILLAALVAFLSRQDAVQIESTHRLPPSAAG